MSEPNKAMVSDTNLARGNFHHSQLTGFANLRHTEALKKLF
jgi:hypothetical protein